MKFIDLVRSDLYRYSGKKTDIKTFLYHFIINPGFKYTFWMRTCAHLSKYRYGPYQIARILLYHYGIKYLIDIPFDTDIGPGLYLGHAMCIVISKNAKLGKSLNISQNVTIGQANRGKRKGCPVVGNYVYVGPGAKILGLVKIGNNVAIGANCVVTRDIPDNAVVIGIPCKIISFNGAKSYVNNKI